MRSDDGLFKHTMLPATMQPCQLYHAASHASSTMQPCHLPCSQLNAELISCVNTFRLDVQLLVIINHVHIMLYQLVTCSSLVHFLMWIVTKKTDPEPDRASTVTVMVCAIVSRVDFH